MLEETTRDVTLEPLDDWIVVEPLDESETASGLIVPINEGAQTRTAIVAAVGPDVETIEPGDKVLFPRDAGFEVRMARPRPRLSQRGSRRRERSDLQGSAREEHPLPRMLFLRYEEGAIRRMGSSSRLVKLVAPPPGAPN